MVYFSRKNSAIAKPSGDSRILRDLDGNRSLKHVIACAIDFLHSPMANLCFDPISIADYLS